MLEGKGLEKESCRYAQIPCLGDERAAGIQDGEMDRGKRRENESIAF